VGSYPAAAAAAAVVLMLLLLLLLLLLLCTLQAQSLQLLVQQLVFGKVHASTEYATS
jgi:hypothetical protein